VTDGLPRIGVVTFPGSLDDRDALRAIDAMGGEGISIWHADATLGDVDAVVLPGGFSYGDYLRAGAIARFARVMSEVRAFAERGGPVPGSATASRSFAKQGSCRVPSSGIGPCGSSAETWCCAWKPPRRPSRNG
jgi:hypothetical protein